MPDHIDSKIKLIQISNLIVMNDILEGQFSVTMKYVAISF